jgi:hypothetical protein
LFDYAVMKLSCDEEPEVQKYFSVFPEKKALFENPKFMCCPQILEILPINEAEKVQQPPKPEEVLALEALQELKEHSESKEVLAPQELKEFVPYEIQNQKSEDDLIILQKISNLKRTRNFIEKEILNYESTIETLKKKKTEIVKEIQYELNKYVDN